ncbi:hypothetical protein ACPCAE_11565 [Streptomyces cinereoruber]|uniref:hypothetical protein n=1 Tax=Streptomyces cinereoruber TaxID=67260 RepID=UPI003C2AB510
MDVKRRRIALSASTAVVVAGLAVGAAYVLEVPPFAGRGVIDSENVCASAGDPGRSVPALKDALPSKAKYSFEDRYNGKNVAEGGSSYNAYCFVRGDGDLLLSTRSRMVLAAPSKEWVAEALGEERTERSEEFEAGALGVVDLPSLKAAVLTPCSAPGTVVGGSYSISTVVHLRSHDGANDAKVKQRLVDLAVEAARFAHRNAKCDLPSGLPVESPRVGADSG